MENKISEINELFDMFHDFDICNLELIDNTLTMQISIPWCEMWEIDEFILTIKFSDCDNLNCIYYVRTSTEEVSWEKGVYHPNEKKETNNPQQIVKMELDIQNHEFKKPNTFLLNCNSSTSFGNKVGQIDFGQIVMTANNYQILGPEGSEIKLSQMKNWANDWWESIEKMHEENKRKKTKR
jgi:hypothetical protein